MAKEFEKFQAEHKKLLAALKKTTPEEAAKAHKRIGISLGNCWEGEDYLRESLAKMRKEGETSTKLGDLQKNKHFKDGLGTWNTAINMHQKEVDALMGLCGDAKGLQAKLDKLEADITKDLKKRSKSSESKKDIEALHETVQKQIADLKKAAAYEGKLNPAQKLYAKNFKRTLDKILKEDPDAQSKKLDATELPQLLVDRNLKKFKTQVEKLAKSVQTSCAAALDKSQTDLKAAAPDLKAAAADVKKMHAIVAKYQQVRKKFPGAIKDSKDSKKIAAQLDTFDKLLEVSARRVKGTTVTIKKAAV